MRISRHALAPLAAAVVGLAVLGAGCSSGPQPATGMPEGKQALENKDRVVYMDNFGSDLIVIGQKAEFLPDRRLKAFANLQNNSDEDLHVLVSIQFKDKDGFATEGETPFANIIVPKNAVYPYQATALNDKAVNYTIRIRRGEN